MKYNLTLLLFLISMGLFAQKHHTDVKNPIVAPCQYFLETITPSAFKKRKSEKYIKKLSAAIKRASLEQLTGCVCTDSLWAVLKRIDYEQVHKVPTSHEVDAVTYYYELPDQLDQMYLDRELVLYDLNSLEEQLEYITNRAVSNCSHDDSQNKYEGTLTAHRFIIKNRKKLRDQYLAIIDNPFESQLKKEIILRSHYKTDKKMESELLTRIDNPAYGDLHSTMLTTLSSIGSTPTLSYLKQKISDNIGKMDFMKPYLLAIYTMKYSNKISQKSKNDIGRFLENNGLDAIPLSELAN